MTKPIKEKKCCSYCLGFRREGDFVQIVEFCKDLKCPCHNPAPQPAEGEKCKCYCHIEKTFKGREGEFSTHQESQCPCYSPSENEGWRERFDRVVNRMFCDLDPKSFEKINWNKVIAPHLRILKELISQEIKEAEERGYVNRGIVEAEIKAQLIKDKTQARREGYEEGCAKGLDYAIKTQKPLR